MIRQLAFIHDETFVKVMRWLFVLFLLITIVLSLVPTSEEIPAATDIFSWIALLIFGDASLSDKVSHFIAYGAVAGAGTLGLVRPLGRHYILPLLLFSLSGALELAQGLVSYRVPDWLDLLANGTGVLSGTISALVLIYISDIGVPKQKARI